MLKAQSDCWFTDCGSKQGCIQIRCQPQDWMQLVENKTENVLYKIVWEIQRFLENVSSFILIFMQNCHDSGHMTVSHEILKSWDLNITKSHLWSDFKLVSDSELMTWRFSQKSLVLYIRLSCILSHCWLSSMSWWSLNQNWMSFIELTVTTLLWSTVSAC